MNGISQFAGLICLTLLDIVSLAMLARSLLSLFFEEDGMIMRFLYSITEPFVIPVRKLLEKLNIMSGMPIDVSFLITYLLLFVLQGFLSIWF